MSQLKQWLDRLHRGSLRWFGNSRVVKSAYLWLFVVPRAVRFIGPFAGEHDVTIPWFNDGGGATFHVAIALPFNWLMFYVMSLVFIVAQVSYAKWCPEIVKRYSSYGEYRAEYAGPSELLRFADHLLSHGEITDFRIRHVKIVHLDSINLDDPALGLVDNSRATDKAE